MRAPWPWLLIPLAAACHRGGRDPGLRFPAALDFGSVLRADPSTGATVAPFPSEIAFVIQSLVDAPVALGGPHLDGPAAAEFALDGPAPGEIPPRGSLGFRVRFTPGGTGERRARLTLSTSAGTVRIALSARVVELVTARLAAATAPGPARSDVAAGEAGGLAAWIEGDTLVGAFVGAEGGVRAVGGAARPRRAFPIAPGVPPPLGAPRVAAVEDGFLVALDAGGDILVVRVGEECGGGPVRNLTADPEPQGAVAVAAARSRALVVWHHAGRSVEAAVVAADGTPLVPRFTVTTDVSGAPPGGDRTELAAASDGSRFLVVHRDGRGSFSGTFVSMDGVPGRTIPLFPAERDGEALDAPAAASGGDGWLVAAALSGSPGGVLARLLSRDGSLVREDVLAAGPLSGTWPEEDLLAAAHDGTAYLLAIPGDGRVSVRRLSRAEGPARWLDLVLGPPGALPRPALAAVAGRFLLATDRPSGAEDVIEIAAPSSEAARIMEWDLDGNPGALVYRPFQIDVDPRASDPLLAGPWITYSGVGSPARNKVAHLDPSTGRFREYRVAPHDANLGLHGVHAREGKVWFTATQTQAPPLVGCLDPLGGEVLNIQLPPLSVPHEVVLDDEGRAWVTLEAGNQVATYDPRARTLTLRALPSPASGPHGLLPRRDPLTGTLEVWLTERQAGRLTRLVPAPPGGTDRWDRWTLPGTTPAEPLFVLLDEAGGAWTALGRTDRLARLDPATGLLGIWELPLVTPAPGALAHSGPLELIPWSGGTIALNEIGTSQVTLFKPRRPARETVVQGVSTGVPAPPPAPAIAGTFPAEISDVLRAPAEVRMVGANVAGEFREWMTVLSGEGPLTGYPAGAVGPTRIARAGPNLAYTETLADRVGWVEFIR